MFQVGDLVVYGTKGVCKVKEIGNKPMPGSKEERLYYTLEPVFLQKSLIYTPVDNQKIVMRTVISKDLAMHLIEDIPNIELLGIKDDKKRESIYHEVVSKCDCRENIKMIKTLYQRKQERAAIGKKVTSLDERYDHMAKDNLFAELSVTLNISLSEVEEFVRKKVETGE